jgi:hypothetical protein
VGDDEAAIVALACSLDEEPGSNWVQKAGGLPEFICEMARAIKRDGKSTSSAIAIAVSRVKQLAAKGNAKAAKAAAQWERLRARSKETVSASAPSEAALETLLDHCIGRRMLREYGSQTHKQHLDALIKLAQKE